MFSRTRSTRWLARAAVLLGVLALPAAGYARPAKPLDKPVKLHHRHDRSDDRHDKSDDRHDKSDDRHDRSDQVDGKLDDIVQARSERGFGNSRVIITFRPGFDPASVRKFGGVLRQRLEIIDGAAVVLPNAMIRHLASLPDILSIHYDRPVAGHLNVAAVTVGARAVQSSMGYDGAGVGVAVIDSGVTSWHDDLANRNGSSAVREKNGQRVIAFVDLVNGRATPYDDNGHGTHVAGIIAGNGYDSQGARAGMAPGAHLVSLKVLDSQGRGIISNVIAALQWSVTNRTAYNIRVVNLSVGAAVTESYLTDPLTRAARAAADAGLVVVTAAGNFGRNAYGEPQYGGITAPGNAPWVLTVGASSTQGTVTRTDDIVAAYSSRGPTAVDFQAKPDLVAPGTGIVSLSDPTSLFYTTKADYLLNGSISTSYKPYLSLSGTSMAAPMVSGTIALMLQANPSLTPNLVKAILQYTAQKYSGYDLLTEGAGFLNSQGAVQLARFYRNAKAGDPYPSSASWSRQIIWGNYRVTGGAIDPRSTAWASNIVWGTVLSGQNIVWGTVCSTTTCDGLVWGAANLENIVWGTALSGENIVWGTVSSGENIVWGTGTNTENIVWGTACGGTDCENIVWGTAGTGENVVWGTALSGENIVWGTASSGENIVWGTASGGENIVWGTSGEDSWIFDPLTESTDYGQIPFEDLFGSLTTTSTAATAAGGSL